MSSVTEISFSQLIEALLDEDTPLHPRYLYRLTDLPDNETTQLEITWPRIALWRRQSLIEDLKQLSEANLLLSFETVGRIAVTDADPITRSLAMHLLNEFDTPDLIPHFLDLLENDANPSVRGSAATVLGRFVFKGEVDELPHNVLTDLENHLLKVIEADPDPRVRRLSLEALSYSSREEIPPLIQKAYSSREKDWVVTALVCMGRSCDEQWNEAVTTMLDHKNPILRAEAVRAAGELEISSTVHRLIDLADDSDEDVCQAAIWSLSQIGGEGVRQALEKLWESAETDDEIELLENAIDNLAFTEDMQPFSILDVSRQSRNDREKGRAELADEDDFRSGEEDPYSDPYDINDGSEEDLQDESDRFEKGKDDQEDEDIDTETAYFEMLDEEDDEEDLT